MSEIRDYVLNKLGEEYFAIKLEGHVPEMAQNRPKFVTLYVLRETIAPFIDRSDDPESTITNVISDNTGSEREVVEIPARKFKSKEKLMGLKICRALGVVDDNYEYNHVLKKEYLKNPNSAIFGDSVVEGGDAGQAMLPSRIYYSSCYSIRKKDQITKKLTHNALSEAGTMWDRIEGKNRTSLFNTEYILPNTFFPSFITLTNPTPETLIHVILSLKERTYGAQTSITGPNINNRIISIFSGQAELPITSYTITKNFGGKLLSEFEKSERNVDKFRDSINNTIIEHLKEESPQRMLYGKEIDEFLQKLNNLSSQQMDEIYKRLSKDTSNLIEYANINKTSERKKKGKQSELGTTVENSKQGEEE